MMPKFIISIDLGGTNLKIALLDINYKIRFKSVSGTKNFAAKEELITAIRDSVKNILRQKGLKSAQILGLGLGVPGPVDAQKGLVHFFPNIPGWKEEKLKAILEKRLKLPVSLDNDAKLMSLAEHRLGAAKGSKNAVCLTLGTGVGGGIILGGKLYRGRDNASGEVGHMPINIDGPKCNCGGNACLEAYIGNSRILKQAKAVFHRDVTLEELSSLARTKNKKAMAIWEEFARHLAVALAGVVNLLNPECVVIGGGIANAGEFLFGYVRRMLSERAMSVQSKGLKIKRAKLGSDAGLIGAAIMVREAGGTNEDIH